MKPTLHVLVACSTLGRVRRGFETFADECFDALRHSERVTPRLIHGPGEVTRPGESAAPLISQFSLGAKAYGRLRGIRHAGRWKYESFTLEHYSFGLSVAHQAVKYGAEVIVYSEPPLGVALGALRRWFGLRYRTLFSNGAPFVPPYPYADHVQQLAPVYLDQALRYGVPANTQNLVPYGFAVPTLDPATKADLRRRLNLPPDRPIIICVAAINASHKRLDYLIDEAAGLGRPGPFVLFLGQTEPESEGIKARAASALAADQYRFLSIPSAEVGAYYQASDLFVLPSIHEGFGRVFGEAMFRGLPCLAHDYPVARYVLGDLGFYADFTRPGGLTGLLRHCLENLPGLAQMADERRNAIRERFSWERLLPAYERLLFTAAGRAAA